MHCRERRPAPNLTDCPRHGDHLDLRAPARRSADAHVRSRASTCRRRPRRRRAAGTASPLRRSCGRCGGARRARARAAEAAAACARGDRRRMSHLPRAPARGRVAGRHPASTPAPGLPNVHESVHFRLRDDLADERSRLLGEPPQSFLPRPHELSCSLVVDDGRACTGRTRAGGRAPAHRTTATARASRSARRPAASTGRARPGSRHREPCAGDHRRRSAPAGAAPARCHCGRLPAAALRKDAIGFKWRVSADPMSYQSPGSTQT